MHKSARKPVSYLLAVILALSSTLYVPGAAASSYRNSIDEEPTGGTMLADTFLVRPLMLVSTVFGAATFVVTLPFSALGGNIGEAGNTLVVEPARYTFLRPLGEL